MQPKTKTTTILVFLIAALSLLTLCAHSQELYLTLSPAKVRYDMNRFDEVTLSVHAKNYLEYQHVTDSIAFAYRFDQGRCTEAMITFPVSRLDRFISAHEYWQRYGSQWKYYSDTFGTYMIITSSQLGNMITFTYTLQSVSTSTTYNYESNTVR